MAKKAPTAAAKKPPAKKKSPPLIKGDAALATRYGKTTKTIYNWRKAGMPFATEPNDPSTYLYDPEATDAWVETKNATGESDPEAAINKASLLLQKLRKATADANQAEREDELAEGNVLDRETYELFAYETNQETRDKILRVPGQFRVHLCKKCQPKIEELERQLHAALKALARLKDGPTDED